MRWLKACIVRLDFLVSSSGLFRRGFFFFQAEDGIRYLTVTGVQTCALPIWSPGFSGPLLSLNPFDRNLGIPYVGAWNLSIQKELPWHFNMEVGYLGSEGVKLLQGLQLNQARLANAANPIADRKSTRLSSSHR